MLGGETVGPRGPLKCCGQVASVFGYFSQLAISPGGAVNVANLFEDLPGALVPSLGLIQKIFFMKQDAQLAAFITGGPVVAQLLTLFQCQLEPFFGHLVSQSPGHC